MTELTPEKIKELTALMAAAPPATAARMLAMFERVQVKGSKAIPTRDLLAALREAGVAQGIGQGTGIVRLPSFQRIFFQPFENLFENGELDALLPGSIARSGLKEVWLHISGRFIPDEVADLEPLGTAAILRGDTDTAYQLAVKLRAALLEALKPFGNETIARDAKSPDCKAALRRLSPLLTAEVIGREIWASAFGAKGELSEHGIASLSANVRMLEDENPDAARELLLLTMATLPRPHEALRVLNKVSLGVDDRKLDMTEFALVGRRVIAIAAREAALIEQAFTTGAFEGAALATIVERYNQCLHGLERETRLASDGPWRQSVVAIRGKVGNRLEIMCQRASQALEAALPVQRIQRHTITWTVEPRLDTPIDRDLVSKAVRHLEFVAASRLFAPLAGFGAPREMAAKHALTHLDLVRDALLKANRMVDKSPHLANWITATRDIIQAVEGQEAAHVFDRRIAASAQGSVAA